MMLASKVGRLLAMILIPAQAQTSGAETATISCRRMLDTANVRVDVMKGNAPRHLTCFGVVNIAQEAQQVVIPPEAIDCTAVVPVSPTTSGNSVVMTLSLQVLETIIADDNNIVWCVSLRHAIYRRGHHSWTPPDDPSGLVHTPNLSVEIGEYSREPVGVTVVNRTCILLNRFEPSCVLGVRVPSNMEAIFHPERLNTRAWGEHVNEVHMRELRGRLQSVIYRAYRDTTIDSSLLWRIQDCGHLRNLTAIDSVAIASRGPVWCHELEHMDFSGNQLRTLDKHIFGGVQQKRMLSMNLSRCEIDDILVDLGFHVPALKYLDMSWNKLTTDSALHSIIRLSDLTILDLSHNRIANISEIHFPNATRMRRLDLSNNLIRILPKIITFRQLQYLDLSSNLIYTISQFIMSGSINILDLTNNTIEAWHSSKTQVFSSVSHVNLSGNHVTFFSEGMIRSLVSLSSVDIGNNPISCRNCRSIGPLWKWLKTDPRKSHGVRVFNCGTESLNISCDFNKDGKVYTVLEVAVDWQPCDSASLIVWITVTVAVFSAIVILIAYRYRYEFVYLMEYCRMKHRLPSGQSKDSSAYMFDAFVLYSHHNRDWVVDHLCPNLEKGPEYYRLCLHERDFPLGSMIIENIGKCLKKSRYIIAVLSPAFIQSKWCRWELEQANNRLLQENQEILIIIVLEKLDRRSIPLHFQFLLDTRTYLEWSDLPSKVQWTRLRRALGRSNYQMGMPLTFLAEDCDGWTEDL